MTLIFLDGFDDKVSSTKWTTGNPTYVTGRNGTGADPANTYMVKTVDAADESDTFIVGFALKTPASTSSNDQLKVKLQSDAALTDHLTLTQTTPGYITVRRGTQAGTILATSAVPIPQNTWTYVEFKGVLHDASGAFSLRFDNIEVASGSNIDTKNAGTKTVFDSVSLFGYLSSSHWFDDFYLCNGTGANNNNFLGDSVVETLYPNANGSANQFLGSDGNSTDNYLLVDEPGTVATADYVEDSNVGERDLYGIGNLTRTSGSVRGIQTNHYAYKSDAGSRSVIPVLISNGTTVTGDALGLSTTYQSKSTLWETDPGTTGGTGSWSIAAVNAIEAGVEVA